MMSKKRETRTRHKRGDRWILLLILLLFLVGLGFRGYAYITQTASRSRVLQQPRSQDAAQKVFPQIPPRESQSFHPGAESAKDIDESPFTNFAPYLTEGGFSFFVGFCLGYFLRFVAKTMIILIGAVYCCLILLSHYGMITVDWGSLQHALQQILLNTQTHVEGLRGIITVGLPSVTMGSLGIWRGLKKP